MANEESLALKNGGLVVKDGVDELEQINIEPTLRSISA